MLERSADPLDQAADYAERMNQDGVARTLAPYAVEKPLILDGMECCRECANVIPAARLKARPQAARCAECQAEIDQRRSHFR